MSNTYLSKLVEYAAATALELRNGSTPNDPMIRLRFKNGTNDEFKTFNMFGQDGDIPLSLFKSNLEFAAINTTAEWCQICNNHIDRGCATCNNPQKQNDTDSGLLLNVRRQITSLNPPHSGNLYSTRQIVEAGLSGSLVTIAIFVLVYLMINNDTRGKKSKLHR